MPISNVKRGVYFSTCSSSAARKPDHLPNPPNREIAPVFPRETSNVVRFLESPSFRLHVFTNVDKVFASFEGLKGIVVSALAEISLLYLWERRDGLLLRR